MCYNITIQQDHNGLTFLGELYMNLRQGPHRNESIELGIQEILAVNSLTLGSRRKLGIY